MQKSLIQFKQYWDDFSCTYQLDADLSQSIYTYLFNAYIESQRSYHTVQHIVECLVLFHQIKKLLDQPFLVELAIWFHDVVYEPQASDNEYQSAVQMQKWCCSFLTSAQCQTVFEWILHTQHHQPSALLDLSYLLDIDLAILGASFTRFTEYEQQIQQEYSWVLPEQYTLKRAEVLTKFAKMNPIYQTAYFRHHFEKQAKSNLQTILSDLY